MAEPNLSLAFGLKPTAAIRYFEKKGLRINPYGWASVAAHAHAKAFTAARTSSIDVVAMLRQEVGRAIKDGTTFDQFQKRLIPKLKTSGWWGKDPLTGAQLGSPYRLATIFRTNIQVAYSEGRWQTIQEDSDFAPWVQYVAVLDSRTRPAHRALDGKVFHIDDPFWKTHRPPLGWNCFLPNTRVNGAIKYGLKSFYSGKAFEISSRSGISLSITANHPIYTNRGWVRANELTKGDYLIRNTGRIDGISEALPLIDNQHSPSIAEQVFESMLSNGLRVVGMPSLQLYENFDGREGKVHIAAANGKLMDDWDASFGQFAQDWELIFTGNGSAVGEEKASGSPSADSCVLNSVDPKNSLHGSLGSADGLGNSDARQIGIFIQIADDWFDNVVSSSGGSPGFSALSFNRDPVSFNSDPFDSFGLRPAADRNASLIKDSSDDISATTSNFRNLLEACSGLVEADEVINIREFDFCGHVYDFETETGVIFAENVLVHNCRCRLHNLTERDLRRDGITPESGTGNMIYREIEVQGEPQPQAIYRDPKTGENLATDVGWGHSRDKSWMPDPADYEEPLRPMVQSIENDSRTVYQRAYDEAIDALITMPMIGPGAARDDILEWLSELSKATQTDAVIAATLQAQQWLTGAQ